MFSLEDHIQIAAIPIRAVVSSLRGRIRHLLERCRRFIGARCMASNLSWFSARHCHDIDIFPSSRGGLALQEPVRLSQLYRLGFAESFALPSSAFALFFYPIHNIGFVHMQDFPHTPSTDAGIIHFDRQFPRFFCVFMPFGVWSVCRSTFFTFIPLRSRAVVPYFYLPFRLSTFRARPVFFLSFSLFFFHSFYFIICKLFGQIQWFLRFFLFSA